MASIGYNQSGNGTQTSVPVRESESRAGSEKTVTALDESQVETAATKPENAPPDGGYGWACVAAVFLVNMHTWGINSTYGVFLAYYLASNTFPGVSYLEFAFVGGLSISTALLISPLATFITRKYGTRTTLLLGVFFQTLALIGASFASQIWQLFLSQGVCFGLGMGFLFVGSVGIVPQWFTRRRSLANGIGTAGSGIGGMLYSLATQAMIEHIGLSWAFRILGIISCVVNLTCALVIRDRNKIIGSSQLAFDYTLFKRGEYVLLQGWGFFSMLGYIVLLFSLPNYALSIGLSPSQGSVIGAILNLGQGLGRPVVGIFSDRAGRINIAAGLSFLAGFFSLAIWTNAKSFGVLVFFAFIVGTVAGVYWTTIAPVGAEVVGLRELPSALSITWLVLVLPTTFSEPIALQLRQSTGNVYLHAQIYTGLMYILASICLVFLRAWKIGELEIMAAEVGASARSMDPIITESLDRTVSRASRQQRSSLMKRLFMWKRV